MIDTYISLLSQIPFFWLFMAAFFITLIENVFPPAPSDMLIVLIAAISGIKGAPVWLLAISATAGSIVGFYIMYILGAKFEHKVVETDKFKFISRKALNKVDKLFQKWGLWLVVANRFLSGTRAVVSFFAGMSALPKTKTILLSGISSFLWYGILVGAGGVFGKDWKSFYGYVELYEQAVIFALVCIVILIAIVVVIKKIIQSPKKPE